MEQVEALDCAWLAIQEGGAGGGLSGAADRPP